MKMINVIKQKLKPEGTEYQQLMYILHFLILTELNLHQYFQGPLKSEVEDNKELGMALYSSLKKWHIGQPPGRVWRDMEKMYSLFPKNSPFTTVAISETLLLMKSTEDYLEGIEKKILENLKNNFKNLSKSYIINFTKIAI